MPTPPFDVERMIYAGFDVLIDGQAADDVRPRSAGPNLSPCGPSYSV